VVFLGSALVHPVNNEDAGARFSQLISQYALREIDLNQVWKTERSLKVNRVITWSLPGSCANFWKLGEGLVMHTNLAKHLTKEKPLKL
jgi:hypothetical protein